MIGTAKRTFAATWLALLPSAALAEDAGKVAVHNWAEYYAETTISDFEAATKIEVIEGFFDSNSVQETILLAGRSGFDVTFPGATGAARLWQAGALQPIDSARLQNHSNLDPKFLELLDELPGGRELGVPYTWGTIGIAHNPTMVANEIGDTPLHSLDTLFNPETAQKLANCGIGVIDSSAEIIPMVMNYLGHDPYSNDAAQLDDARKVLEAFVPSVRYFNSTSIAKDLASGEICVAITYNGEASFAQDIATEAGNNIKLTYAIPTEGTHVWMDMMTIPVDAPNLDGAYAFIDYILKPDVIAAITNTVYYANANAAATPMVSDDIRNDPGTYPDDATMKKLFLSQTADPKLQRLWTRMWTSVKSGT